MMFPQLFEDRDRRITLLVKLGDCLGRSLRENVILFSVNSNENKVAYLTEGQKIIEGAYSLAGNVVLSDITVQDSSILEDEDLYDQFVESKISNFIEKIYYNELFEANNAFDDVLSVWNSRMKLGQVQKRLFEKSEKLASIEKIVESEEFSRVLEIAPQLVEFLIEKKEKITCVPEIRNAVQLSNTISEAFDFPKISLENLVESGSYTLKDGNQESIYEMICRQELVKKELVESKKQFNYVWATNPVIKNLASCIFESEDKVEEALVEAIQEVPYFALASKKSINETITNCLSRVDGLGVDESDITEYTSRLFEAKKDAKEIVVQTLNEKYGVDVQNLNEPISFKSLSNTQVIIFETLSRLAPKGSILKSVLSEAASFMKGKHGVECIDVNELIYEMFKQSGYLEDLGLENQRLEENVSLSRVTKEITEAKVEKKPKAEDKEQEEEVEEPEEAPSEEEVEEPEAEKEATEEPKTKSQDDVIDDMTKMETLLKDIVKDLKDKEEE
jgi:hypothetical protein